MNAQQIAMDVVAALTPVLPFMKAGAEELSKKVGEVLGNEFQTLWRRIFAHKPVEQAAAKAGDNPEDPEVRQALVRQLETLMQYNAELAKELEAWAKARRGGTTVTASHGGVVIHGSGNKVATNGSVIVERDVYGGLHIGRGKE